jgi:hypothetical protein
MRGPTLRVTGVGWGTPLFTSNVRSALGVSCAWPSESCRPCTLNAALTTIGDAPDVPPKPVVYHWF